MYQLSLPPGLARWQPLTTAASDHLLVLGVELNLLLFHFFELLHLLEVFVAEDRSPLTEFSPAQAIGQLVGRAALQLARDAEKGSPYPVAL